MERKLKALIVDDEKKAVVLLQRLLEDTGRFDELRSASSPISVGDELKGFLPDIIFLDIKMPGQDGLSLLRELRAAKTTAEVVFVTAYDQYALEALKNYAFGYLLKPVNRNELSECIERVKEVRVRQNLSERFDSFLDAYQDIKIRFNTRTGYFFLDPADILYCEADGNYSTIQTAEKQYVCSLQLGAVHEKLPTRIFKRLGRSLIINFKYVSSVDRKKFIILFQKNGQSFSINVSGTQLKELERLQG